MLECNYLLQILFTLIKNINLCKKEISFRLILHKKKINYIHIDVHRTRPLPKCKLPKTALKYLCSVVQTCNYNEKAAFFTINLHHLPSVKHLHHLLGTDKYSTISLQWQPRSPAFGSSGTESQRTSQCSSWPMLPSSLSNFLPTGLYCHAQLDSKYVLNQKTDLH